jgi:hypothetical protein
MCVRQEAVAHLRNHTQRSAFSTWLRGPTPHSPQPFRAWGHGSRQFLIGRCHEDREICRSPRSEGSLSARCSRRDGHHARREFAFDDLILKQVSCSSTDQGGGKRRSVIEKSPNRLAAGASLGRRGLIPFKIQRGQPLRGISIAMGAGSRLFVIDTGQPIASSVAGSDGLSYFVSPAAPL